MPKTEVYSWRLSQEMKSALEEAARREGQTVSGLIERIVRVWLDDSRHFTNGDAHEQARLHQEAARAFGTIQGGNPRRAATIRSQLRARLKKHHAG